MKKKEGIWKSLFKKMKLPFLLVLIAIIAVLIRGMAEMGEVSAIDKLFQALQDKQTTIVPVILETLFFLTLEASMGAIVALLLGVLASRSMFYLRGALTEHILCCDVSEISGMGTGDLQSRLQADTKQSVQWVRVIIEKIIYGSVLLLGAIGLSFYANWLMALVSLVMVPVVMFISVICSQGIGKKSKMIRKAEGNANQVIQEMIWQIPDTKALSREKEWERRIQTELNSVASVELDALKAEICYKPIMLFAKFFPQVVILFLGGYLLTKNKIGIGDLMLFTLLFGYIANGLAGIPQWMSNYRKASASGNRVKEILDLRLSKGKAVVRKEKTDVVNLNGICASYEEKEVLSNISLSIEKGKHVAIIGESGCGKTTLLKVITGILKPNQGEGHVGGIDIFACMPEQLYEQISMLQQETFLFPDTIKENLVMGKNTFSTEQILKACKQAQILEYINSQEKGLDTVLVEAGRNLSGGQRQRLGIVRAMLKNTPIWILDEPTASLDKLTGEALIKEVKQLAVEKTLIMVTHHLAQVVDMDEIYYMEHGEIVESGTHEELMKLNGGYANLYRKQTEQTE